MTLLLLLVDARSRSACAVGVLAGRWAAALAARDGHRTQGRRGDAPASRAHERARRQAGPRRRDGARADARAARHRASEACCSPCSRTSSAATRTLVRLDAAWPTGARTTHRASRTDGLDARHRSRRAEDGGRTGRGLAVVETVRTRSRWVVPFLLLVVAGNGILTTTVKNLADRVRPELNPIAETLGTVVPERSLLLVGGVLRSGGAAAQPWARTPGARGPRRRRGRARGDGRGEPRPAQRALAE